MKRRRTNEWTREKHKLKKIYKEKEIETCEIRFEKCMGTFGLSFAHRHKRIWYYDKLGLLGSFNETVLACGSCHAEIEKDKELTEEVFNRLRKNNTPTGDK